MKQQRQSHIAFERGMADRFPGKAGASVIGYSGVFCTIMSQASPFLNLEDIHELMPTFFCPAILFV